MRNYLKTEDSVTEDDLTILENRVLDKVGQEFNRAKNSAKPDIRTIFQNAGEL
jgi:TPP-dependent pyruvate/acetoin dehydrogenase alpha subunit